MSLLGELRERLRALRFRSREDAELDEELLSHLEMETEANLRRGMEPGEARRQARLTLGGVEQIKEEVRDARGLGGLEDLGRDIRIAARGLRRSPGLLIGAVLSLGLAIGLNTAVFSFGNWLLLKPLPVPAGNELVHVEISKSGPGPGRASYPDYLDFQAHARTLRGLATHAMNQGTVRLEGSAPVAMPVQLVSGNFFQVLGLRPALGRFFLPEEDHTPGTHPVVVVGHHYWQHTMGGDPGVVGRTIILNREPFTIVGVAPEGFAGTRPPVAFDVFVPMMMRGVFSPDGKNPDLGRDGNWGQLLGRLRPGITAPQVQAELAGIARGLARSYPATHAGVGVEVMPARGAGPELKHSGVPLLMYLAGAVVIALLVACANVAGLMLARAAARRREVAIRLSLGAGRLALVRQLLIESLLLALPAGVLGYLLAPWGTDVLQGILVGPAGSSTRTNMDLAPDGRVLAFTLALSFGSVLLFGLVPALQATRLDLLRSLRGEAPAGRWQCRLGSAVVVAQVAFSVVLLFSAGVLVRGVLASLWADPGFPAGQVVAAPISPEGPGYEEPARRDAFFAELVRRLEARPEFAAVGLGSAVVLDFAPELVVGLPGEVLTDPGAERRVPFNAVTPGVIELLGIPLLRGRTLRSQDREGAPLIAVVNETMARRLWPGRDALGERFQVEGKDFEVIGLVADAKYIGTEERRSPYLFLSYSQNRERVWSTNVYARVRAPDVGAAIPLIRQTVQALDPEVPVTGARTLAENLRYVLQPARAIGTLIGIGAALALMLAAIGTYALLSYSVARRTREIGVRVALGARAADVRRLIVGEGFGLTILGTLVGLPLGWAGARALRAMIPGIGPADPLSVGGVALMLLAVAAAASWLPAWRATRMDPMDALRIE